MDMEDLCDTGLNLGLGFMPTNDDVQKWNKGVAAVSSFEPYLTLALSVDSTAFPGDLKKKDRVKEAADRSSALSSFSIPAQVKRERDVSSEEVEADRVYCDEDDDGVTARKKLRLTKEQSALLEESFKHHSSLNPKQKQDLARQLNMRSRQVEVWFQNRRARTKLKQTESDCEFLKKWCEILKEENRRLQKEVQELKLGGTRQPLIMHMTSSALCPSCECSTTDEGENKTPLFNSKPNHLYNPFINNPSAAC